MESINKFKALTIIIVCMFVFIIAAIYSNTKDVAGTKTQQKAENISNQNDKRNVQQKQDTSVEYLESQFNILNKRVDELSEKVSSEDSGVTCKIIGVANSEGITRLSQEEALEDARDNGSEIVITCSF